MDTTSPRIIQIATEGLRLVQECKMPRFCYSAEFDHLMVEQQEEQWSEQLPFTLPPLLDWIEQHRLPLFNEERDSSAAPVVVLQEFHRRFVLVFLEQLSGFVKKRDFEWEKRLYKFSDDVRKILTTNAALRSWLFHYYGSELGLRGWQSRPGDLYGFYRLFDFLRELNLDDLFGQKMVLFLEHIAKELLEFEQNMEYQTIGILAMAIVMESTNGKQNFTKDAEEILRMTLQLSRKIDDGYGDELWTIIYCTLSSTRGPNSPNSALDDEVMSNLLAHLNEQLMKKEGDPTYTFGDETMAHLKAVTLLLLLDVPDVDLNKFHFDQLTIYGRLCDRDTFRRHVKFHLRTTVNLRFSVHVRIRIANMIPKLFAGFTTTYCVDRQSYRCVELLAWLTMFPASQSRQHKNARANMLHRLLGEIRRLCEHFIKNPSEYSYDEDDLKELYGCLNPMVLTVQDGIRQLPNAGWFRRFRSAMEVITVGVLFMVNVLRCVRFPEEGEEEQEEQQHQQEL